MSELTKTEFLLTQIVKQNALIITLLCGHETEYSDGGIDSAHNESDDIVKEIGDFINENTNHPR